MAVSRALSTTHRGTAFEERSLRILEAHLSMSLRRVGGKSDGGIDLLGWWWLPAPGSHVSTVPRRRLRVLAQCKAEKKRMSPKYVREMEGVLHRYLVSSPQTSPPTSSLDDATSPPVKSPVVGLLISESPFTKSTVLRAVSSPIPFFLLHLPPSSAETSALGEQDPAVGSEEAPTWTGTAIWNPALGGGTGLLGGEIEARWEHSLSGSGRPSLWWRNEKLRSWAPEGEMEELGLI